MNTPPKWSDALDAFNDWHTKQYGTIIERPWASDADSQAAKLHIDEQYLKALQDYNDANGTSYQPDSSVLGASAQPNDYSHHRNSNSGFLSDTISHMGGVVSNSPLLAAAITAIAAANGVPPAVTAAALGLNKTAQTGDIKQGLITGGLSYLGGTGLNNYTNTGSVFGVSDAALAGAGAPIDPSLSLSLSKGAATFGQGSALSTGKALAAVPLAEMGGGTGLTLASAGLPSLAEMGTGTGLLAGGMSAAGPVAGGTAATAGALGPALDASLGITPVGALNSVKAIDVGKVLNATPAVLKAVGAIGSILSGPGEQSGGTTVRPEWMDRPLVRWNQEKLAADAAARNQSINEFMADNWDKMGVGGVYTLASGGQVSEGPLRQVSRFVSEGGGSGRDDMVSARLSPDEYVFDAETTALLGDGSPREGARRLDQMRAEIRKHKGKSLAEGKIRPNAKSPLAYLKERQ